jgi:dTDP-4-dehydrorhamnose 3,5-epimerase
VEIRPLAIADAFEITPRQVPDDRGVFLESFRGDLLAEKRGRL